MASLKHSVAVNVRVRPDGSAPIPFDRFQYPSSIIEGSDQTAMSSALTGDLVRKFIRGGTACTLMAYGQTGSGKTYTMFGPAGALTEASLEQAAGSVPVTWGAFPRATMQLLQAPELAGATFHASAVEIYMEHAYDLLDGRKPVKVGSAKGSGRGTLVVGDDAEALVSPRAGGRSRTPSSSTRSRPACPRATRATSRSRACSTASRNRR